MDFSASWVLSRSFSIWAKNLIPFVILTAIMHVPLVIYTYVAIGNIEQSSDPESTFQWWAIIVGWGSTVLGLVSSGAIIYGVVQEMRGNHAALGDSIAVGLRRFFPVLGVAILVAICIGLGFLALVIPGIIISCMLYVAVPAAVIEDTGVGNALSRSKQLTDGYKMRIFGISFVIGVLQWLAGWLLQKAFLGSLSGLMAYAYSSIALDCLFGSLFAVASAVTYATLRKDREGADAEELARVFT
jgi:hypothetical protein